MKNQTLFEKNYLLGELEEQQQFVCLLYLRPLSWPLDNLAPTGMYYDWVQGILGQMNKIMLNTLAVRRKIHHDNQAKHRLTNLRTYRFRPSMRFADFTR